MPSREKKKLGAWFPKASVIKGAVYDPAEVKEISILLFYKYVSPQWSESRTLEVKAWLEQAGARLNLGGRLRVAAEGLNATVTGPTEAVRTFSSELLSFDPRLAADGGIDFKYIDAMPLDRAFKDLKVLPVKELVYYGIDQSQHTLGLGGTHLSPQDYHQKLASSGENTVVIDVRNAYESDIGRFDGQKTANGATLLDPQMRKSTDFPTWLSQPEVRSQLKGKEVLMYCTGGVRCERASALLQSEIGNEINGCFQLQGGVEKYLQEFPDGGFWRGKNFVFDKREAFGVGAPQGVGGVVSTTSTADGSASKKKKKKKAKQQEYPSEEGADEGGGILGHCCVCNVAWDRYIGKKKCGTCQVPVLVCAKCCEQKAKLADPLATRCPLCIAQKVVVPASFAASHHQEGDEGRPHHLGKVAPTLCTWGGGSQHASKQKTLLQQQQQQQQWQPPTQQQAQPPSSQGKGKGKGKGKGEGKGSKNGVSSGNGKGKGKGAGNKEDFAGSRNGSSWHVSPAPNLSPSSSSSSSSSSQFGDTATTGSVSSSTEKALPTAPTAAAAETAKVSGKDKASSSMHLGSQNTEEENAKALRKKMKKEKKRKASEDAAAATAATATGKVQVADDQPAAKRMQKKKSTEE